MNSDHGSSQRRRRVLTSTPTSQQQEGFPTATAGNSNNTEVPRSLSAPDLTALPLPAHPSHKGSRLKHSHSIAMFEAAAAAALEDSDPFFFHHVQDPNDSNHSHPNHSHSAGASGSTLPASSSPFHAFEHETGVLRGLAPHHRSSSCGASGDFTREAASSHRRPMRRSESLTNLKIETNFKENTPPGKAILHSEEKGRGMGAAGTGKAKKKVQVCEPTAAEGKSDLEMENSSESSSGDNYNNVYLPPSSAAMNSDAQDSDADFYKIFAGGVHAETGLYVEEDERPVPASGMMRGNGPYRRPPPLRTRNVNALRAFIWDQRVFLPVTRGWLSDLFTLFASPRFLEKCDWAFRGSVLCILPPLILCLEPSTRGIFPLPTSVVAYAFWISGPTFGQVLKELYLCLKGFSISLTIMCVFISIQPGPTWLCLLLFFITIVIVAFIAEDMRRTCAFITSSLVMQYIRNHKSTTYSYIKDYFVTLLIALAFGLAPSFFPFLRWSSENAKHYIYVLGDSISLSVRGVCSCFWMRGPLERQLCVTRLRQLRVAIEESMKKAETFISHSGYEPHTGVYIMQLKTRLSFFRNTSNILLSLCTLLEEIADNPQLINTAMCDRFGEEIKPALRRLAIAFDIALVRIASLDDLVTEEEIAKFRFEGKQFEMALAEVRQRVILQNEDYVTENVDVLLGFYLFSLEELVTSISNFKENPAPRNNLIYFAMFIVRDLESTWVAMKALVRNVRHRHSITRRCKEAIKMALCIVLAAIFQVYGMQEVSSSAANALAGVDIIALIYQRTGAESFQYAISRLLGTVLGSLTGLLVVQIAQQRRPMLYGLSLVLNFIGVYVMASPNWNPLGSAITNSVISIVIQYQNEGSAMLRIQQNCFAILIYFIISSVVWPTRARLKMRVGFDVSLRFYREACLRLLSNLDTPEGEVYVAEDVLKLVEGMQKRINTQRTFLSGAVSEPTMDSSDFPEEKWRLIIRSQQRLRVNLLMMRHAYNTFMTSKVGPGISVHWVLLRRLAPHARHLSKLLCATVDIYLSAMAHAAIVPTAKLTKLRQEMISVQRKLIQVYIESIDREMAGDEEEEEMGSMTHAKGSVTDREGSASSSAGHAPTLKGDLGKKGDKKPKKKAPQFDKDEEDIFHLHSYNNNNSIFGIATPIFNKSARYPVVKVNQAHEEPHGKDGSETAAAAVPAHLEETTEVDTASPLLKKSSQRSQNEPNNNNNNNNNKGVGYMGYKISDREREALKQFLQVGTASPLLMTNNASHPPHQGEVSSSSSREPTTPVMRRETLHHRSTIPVNGSDRDTVPSSTGKRSNQEEMASFESSSFSSSNEETAQPQENQNHNDSNNTTTSKTDSYQSTEDGKGSQSGSPKIDFATTVTNASFFFLAPREFTAEGSGHTPDEEGPATPMSARSATLNNSVTETASPHLSSPHEKGIKNRSFLHVVKKLKNGLPPSAPEVDKKNNIITNNNNNNNNNNGFNNNFSFNYGLSNFSMINASFNALNTINNNSILIANSPNVNAVNNSTFTINNATFTSPAELIQNNFSFYNAEKSEFVLTNRDVHSLEAFLYGVRAVVRVMDELEKHVLDMMHQTEMTKKL